MSSKMIINVKDVSIVVPDTGTPDTGMFSVTHSDGVNSLGNMIAPIIGISVVTLMLIAVIVKICKGRKQKKNASFKIHSGRRLALRFGGLALILLISAFALIKCNEKQDFVQAESLIVDDGLSISAEDININVELGDEPVYAMSKSIVKVNTASLNGYTLMAYVDSETADLVNETNPKSGTKISGLDSSYAQALGENTWGVALTSPDSFDAPVFRGLPIGEKNAMTVKVTGSVATPADDITPLYYATYLVPGLDEGKYSGATINYIAVANPTTDDITVNFNVYNEETGREELYNTMVYGLDCALAYVGSNCQKAYAGESVTVESSTMTELDIESEVFAKIKPIKIEGVDLLKVNIDADLSTNRVVVVVLKGYYVDEESFMTAMQELVESGGNPQDLILYASYAMDEDVDALSDEIFASSDSVTIVYASDVNTDSEFSAEITPIYMEKPSGVETTETSVCYVVESGDNVAIFIGRTALRPVTIPGASRVRVEVDYNFPAETMGLAIIEGSWGGNYEDAPEVYRQMGSVYQDDAGVKTFDFDGDTVTFYMMNWMNNPLISDYGFTAKIYPLYDDETEGAEPTQTCRVVKKSGVYKEPDWFDNYDAWWYAPMDYDGDGEFDGSFDFQDEKRLESMLSSEYDWLKGSVLNVYVD